MSQQITPRYFVQCVDEFTGFSDYWSGHGHTFEKDAIGCLVVALPVAYDETNQEIASSIKEDQAEFEDLTENQTLDLELAEKALQTWINQEIPDNQARYFDPNFYDPIEHEEDFQELPSYILVFHVYEETDKK